MKLLSMLLIMAAIMGAAAPAPSYLWIEETYKCMREPAGSVVMFIVRTGSTVGAVSVDYATEDFDTPDQAVAGVDYTATHGTATFHNGQSARFMVLIPLPGKNPPDSRKFKLVLSNFKGALPGQTTTAQICLMPAPIVPTGPKLKT